MSAYTSIANYIRRKNTSGANQDPTQDPSSETQPGQYDASQPDTSDPATRPRVNALHPVVDASNQGPQGDIPDTPRLTGLTSPDGVSFTAPRVPPLGTDASGQTPGPPQLMPAPSTIPYPDIASGGMTRPNMSDDNIKNISRLGSLAEGAMRGAAHGGIGGLIGGGLVGAISKDAGGRDRFARETDAFNHQKAEDIATEDPAQRQIRELPAAKDLYNSRMDSLYGNKSILAQQQQQAQADRNDASIAGRKDVTVTREGMRAKAKLDQIRLGGDVKAKAELAAIEAPIRQNPDNKGASEDDIQQQIAEKYKESQDFKQAKQQANIDDINSRVATREAAERTHERAVAAQVERINKMPSGLPRAQAREALANSKALVAEYHKQLTSIENQMKDYRNDPQRPQLLQAHQDLQKKIAAETAKMEGGQQAPVTQQGGVDPNDPHGYFKKK